MTGQADDAHVVGEVFAAELCTEANAVSLFEYLFLELYVAECAAIFVARGGQVVVVVGRGQLDSEQVLLAEVPR